MEKIINVQLMLHPANWVIITLIVAFTHLALANVVTANTKGNTAS